MGGSIRKPQITVFGEMLTEKIGRFEKWNRQRENRAFSKEKILR